MTASAPDGRPLVGRVVRLDPTAPDDDAGLFAALADDRVWAAGYSLTGGPPATRPAQLRPALLAAVQQRELGPDHPSYRVAYTVRLVADSELGDAGAVVGTTSLGDVVLRDERAHLGWTAYGPRWWGTSVNAECKL